MRHVLILCSLLVSGSPALASEFTGVWCGTQPDFTTIMTVDVNGYVTLQNVSSDTHNAVLVGKMSREGNALHFTLGKTMDSAEDQGAIAIQVERGLRTLWAKRELQIAYPQNTEEIFVEATAVRERVFRCGNIRIELAAGTALN